MFPSGVEPRRTKRALQNKSVMIDWSWLVATEGGAGYLEPSEVHNGLDEDGVIPNVGVLRVQFGEWTEERAAAGDVHVADGPLEGRGGDVGPEGVDDVLPVVLVKQHQGHLGTKCWDKRWD